MGDVVKIAYKDSIELEISSLNNLQGDLKSLSEENYKKLRKEILDTGFAFSPHVWQDPEESKWYLVDGHQRLRVLQKIREGGGYVPPIKCVPVDASNIIEAKQRVLQGVSQYGDVNQDKYFEFMTTGAMVTVDEASLRFENPQVDFEEIKAEYLNDTVEGEDEIPEQVEAKTKLGDLYRLGNHRLLCGDSTDSAMVSTLVGSERMDMVFTDPPYGINLDTDYSKKTHSIPEKNIGTKKQWNKIIGDKDYSPIHIFEMFDYCKEIFIWGANNFASKFKSDEGSWIVWDKTLSDTMDETYGSNFELCWSKTRHKYRIARIKWSGIFGMEKDDSKRVHPTQKPAVLAEWFFDKWGKDAKNIIDLFGGSGSTLIACEKTKRKCFMMELDQHYCDVIVARWEKFTGLKSELIKS